MEHEVMLYTNSCTVDDANVDSKPHYKRRNTYLIIHRSHPLFEMSMHMISACSGIDINYSCNVSKLRRDLDIPERYLTDDYRVMGRETVLFATYEPIPELVAKEDKKIYDLAMWLYFEHIKAVRNDNRNECGTAVREDNEGSG